MTQENKALLKKRSKSLLWRLGGMIVAVVLNWLTTNIGLFNLPMRATGMVGLVIGEVTKMLNKKGK